MVSASKSWSIRRPNSEGSRGCTYSGDISSEASIVSRSGPLIEVLLYGARAATVLSAGDPKTGSRGSAEVIESVSCLSNVCSSCESKSDLAMSGTTFVISDSL